MTAEAGEAGASRGLPSTKRRRKASTTTSSLNPLLILPPNPPSPPSLPDPPPPQVILHDTEEADSSLLHNTVTGLLLERHQLQPPPAAAAAAHAAGVSEEGGGGDHVGQQSNLSSSSQSAIPHSPSSPPPLTFPTTRLPPHPPLPSSPEPSSTPAVLGYYQCERCTALLSYSSLDDVYHCSLCSHTFTPHPSFSPPSSHLFLPTYSPFPTLPLQVALTWSTSTLSSHFSSLPPPPLPPHLLRRLSSLHIDGKRFLELSLEDVIDELGLWGGGGSGGGKAEANAVAVVRLMEVQAGLRGEVWGGDGPGLVAMLTGMQKVAAGGGGAKERLGKGLEAGGGGKQGSVGVVQSASKPVKSAGGGGGAATGQAARASRGKGLAVRPVKRYSLPAMPTPDATEAVPATALAHTAMSTSDSALPPQPFTVRMASAAAEPAPQLAVAMDTTA